MKCPNCSREIADTTIICPFCNTQFAFSAPSSNISNSQELYEQVEKPEEHPIENSLPTEPIYPNEEEINPEDMRYYVEEKPTNEETMHIFGKPIEINENVPVDPMNMGRTSPIRPEAPNNINQSVSYSPTTPTIPNQVVNEMPKPEVNNNRTSTLKRASVSTANLIPESPVTNRVESYINEPVNTGVSAPESVRTMDTIGVANVAPIDTNKKKKDEIFFMAVIVIGMFVLIALIFLMIFRNSSPTNKEDNTTKPTETVSKATSSNIGFKSTFNYPLYPGSTALASYYDADNKVTTDVDVYGSRFITGIEASELAAIYAKEPLNEGFEWTGFEYRVTFNDLTYLKDTAVSPILDSKVYKFNGCDFFKYNSLNYLINITTIYDGGNIKNKESATIKVLFQAPIGDEEYSICFGNIDSTIGCFARK